MTWPRRDVRWMLAAIVAAAGGLRAGAATPGATGAPGGDAYHRSARQAVERVLARPEFADLEPGWFETFLQWALGMLEVISEFLEGLPAWLWWVLVVWMVLTLVAIAIHLVYTLMTAAGGGRGAAGGSDERPEYGGELYGVRELEFDSVYQRSQELLTAGDWPRAVRHLYVAALLWLDREGRIAFRKSKSNHDYLVELGHHSGRPGGRRVLEGLTGLFEDVVYGHTPPSRAVCDRMTMLLERLRHEDAAHATE